MKFTRIFIVSALLISAFAFIGHATYANQHDSLPQGWNLSISGNGSGSSTSISQSVRVVRTVVQSNNGTVTNSVQVSGNTGGNSSSNNTGGSTSITNGALNFVLSIINRFNRNVSQ